MLYLCVAWARSYTCIPLRVLAKVYIYLEKALLHAFIAARSVILLKNRKTCVFGIWKSEEGRMASGSDQGGHVMR